MKIDSYTKLVLTVIALALAVIAVRPLLSPTPSYAQRAIQYKVMILGMNFPDQASLARLNEMGKEGWDIATVIGATAVMKK
jgi:hypothetical protein